MKVESGWFENGGGQQWQQTALQKQTMNKLNSLPLYLISALVVQDTEVRFRTG